MVAPGVDLLTREFDIPTAGPQFADTCVALMQACTLPWVPRFGQPANADDVDGKGDRELVLSSTK